MRKTEKDIYKDRKDFADIEVVLKNGNYFTDYNIKFYYKLTWFLDLVVTNIIYVFAAITLGWIVDDYLVQGLDKSQNKGFIFAQATGQFLYLFVVFYLVIYLLGNYLPSIAVKEPPEHTFIKKWISSFLAIAALFVLEPKLVAKLRYVFYGT